MSSGDLVDALMSLGFTQYESRTYIGLLREAGQTAYSVSKVSGVSQPKVYEALRRLEIRGAAVQVGADPLRFTAMSPEDLISGLRSEISARFITAERELARVLDETGEPEQSPTVMSSVTSRDALMRSALTSIRSAESKLYISGWVGELSELAEDVASAAEAGVESVALVFGREPVPIRVGRVFQHQSTAKMVYPNHQNRHLAIVRDGLEAIWGMYSPEKGWTALISSDRRMIGLTRGFIRHDIYVQKTFEQFGPEMEEVFGPGMELLADVFTDAVLTDRSARATAEDQHLRSA